MVLSNMLLVAAGLLALLTAAIHGVLGTREILRPVLAAPLGAVVRGTTETAWHLMTWHFVVLGVGLVCAPLLPVDAAAAVAMISGVSALGYAIAFLAFGWRRFHDPWHMPQWVLFVPMAATSLAAPWMGGAGASVRGDIAAAIAIVVLVAIAGLHVGWAAGASFPARDRDALVRLVVGAPIGQPMPGRVATWVVAIGLVGMAGWTAALRGWIDAPMPRAWLVAGALAMVAIFTLRGIGGFFEVVLRPSIRDTPYMHWSRRLYSPIALGLATTIACAMLA
jgi:hypothetical protein